MITLKEFAERILAPAMMPLLIRDRKFREMLPRPAWADKRWRRYLSAESAGA